MVERRKRRDPVDFVGLGVVALGVGLLEFTLDKGQEKDWFGSGEIQLTALLAVVLLLFFTFWEWRHPDPIVDLKLLKNRNFGTAVFLQLILGMVLFGSTVLIPQYLQTLLGYTAELSGLVLSPAGFVMMAGMAIAGKTLGKGDPRMMVMLGYIATALGLYNLTRLDLHTSFQHAMLWRMLQVVGLPFIFIPISTLNYVGVPREKSNQISSLSNFARNLGGSAGTALLTTYLARSAQVHQTALAANLSRTSQSLRSYISTYAAAAHISVAAARPLALATVYRQMLAQASMLAYKNAFAILALTALLLSPLVWIMRLPPKPVKKAESTEAAEAELEPMVAH
jgi:DHA2 family multidrug resistance protein